MEVIIESGPEHVAQRCADICAAELRGNPRLTLGLATGSTPLMLYRELIERHRRGDLTFAEVTTFNLDEYVGLSPEHPQSYRAFMEEHLFRHIDLPPSRTHLPDGAHPDPVRAAREYEEAITAAGGIDFQILGIGRNGHIGFNEPTSSLGSRTRIKTLTRRTLEDNSRFFKPGEFQPRLAITMGIRTILEARRVLLLATGESKAEAVAAAVEGPIAAICPASSLQWHPKAIVVLDQAAASKLCMTDYYNLTVSEQDALNRERLSR